MTSKRKTGKSDIIDYVAAIGQSAAIGLGYIPEPSEETEEDKQEDE